jgi:hypothetical protein
MGGYTNKTCLQAPYVLESFRIINASGKIIEKSRYRENNPDHPVPPRRMENKYMSHPKRTINGMVRTMYFSK